MHSVELLGEPTDRLLRAMHRLSSDVVAETERPPGAASTSYADFVSALLAPAHGVTIDRFVARNPRGALVGAATLAIRDAAALRGVGKFYIEVPARTRRQGIGSALLSAVRTQALWYGMDTLYSWAPASGAGLGFLANVLDRPRGEEIWSVLDLRRRSAGEAIGSVGDLDIHRWLGPCPADLLVRFAEAHRAVGASVRGSEAGSELVTPELLAALETAAQRGDQRWLTIAASDPVSGSMVGFSQIDLPEPSSTVAHQQFTGVDPRWRRRGIARWLKALSSDLLGAEYPEVRFVITENAADNTAIRTLNIAMGFRVYRHLVAWQESL